MKQLVRNTERLLNYNMYQFVDESGVPHHYLLETVGSSSNSDSGKDVLLRSNDQSTSKSLYQSQRASLFEEFVDQTQTNFSRSEFDKSISLVEIKIQSQIFTRKFPKEEVKKSRFSIGKSKRPELPDPKVVYSLAIGDVVMCKWSGEEENWESKTTDPALFPYASPPTQASTPKSRKKTETPKQVAAYPPVVTKRLCIPFEFRFIN